MKIIRKVGRGWEGKRQNWKRRERTITHVVGGDCNEE
jgi:hypothetical protein